ncbi:TRAP transporter small permease [Petroclostridium sp. X23]|uniref:TRAP transporter small permease n=1 Tax=Petroclostridium sp. X23 TaxID=3045146 RepID=UPI0024ACD8BF|nr:TRAP transporter small permease [Petroclostridium sp. X23]WHH58545.1 TRAP transporter small permease [Petroclostridium sp. X23]
MINKIKNLWDKFELYLMVVFLGVFLLNIFVQIIMRLFFKSPLSFTEEVSRYSFVWMVFLGLSFATRYDKHIRVDFLYARFPKIIQFIVDMLLNVLTLAVFIWIFHTGLKYVEYSSITRTYALNIQKSIVVAIIPLSGLLMIIRVIEKFFRDIKHYFPSRL